MHGGAHVAEVAQLRCGTTYHAWRYTCSRGGSAKVKNNLLCMEVHM